jgi:hypothetical protein
MQLERLRKRIIIVLFEKFDTPHVCHSERSEESLLWHRRLASAPLPQARPGRDGSLGVTLKRKNQCQIATKSAKT